MLSPLERMIDEACGFTPTPSVKILIRCVECKRERNISKIASDPFPENTAEIAFTCPDCSKGKNDTIRFFDKNGKELNP